MDGVELAFAFEEAFGIEIPDEEAEKMRTPGNVVEYFCQHVPMVRPRTCITRLAFRRVRDALREVLGTPNARLRPSTPLETLLPLRRRRGDWEELGRRLGQDTLPELALPADLCVFGIVLCLVVGCSVGLVDESILVGCLATVVAALRFSWLARPFARGLYPGMQTVGDLAVLQAAQAAYEVRLDSQRGGGWTRERISLTVRHLVSRQFGRFDFDEDSGFIDDLGMD